MNVVVDTSILSMALRRRQPLARDPMLENLLVLIDEDEVLILGPVRQELLSGIRDKVQFHSLKGRLLAYREAYPICDDFETAAEMFNTCQSAGIQGSHVDLLICAMAARLNLPIFTLDKDFERYAKHLPIRLYAA
jgi:predicted nucleic acid-binding protein